MAGVYTSGSGTIIIDITQTVASNRLYRGTQQSYTIDSSKKNDHMRLHGDGISMQEGGIQFVLLPYMRTVLFLARLEASLILFLIILIRKVIEWLIHYLIRQRDRSRYGSGRIYLRADCGRCNHIRSSISDTRLS